MNAAFDANSRVGDAFIGPDGLSYEIANVASPTVISILPPYKGATVSGAAYAIMPVQGYDKLLRDAFSAVNQRWGNA
ncbi:tail fiber domain-containing protein, partial [Pseudomonas syringae pv. tomato]|nr:tail fiber domain-containing protein [Pseudomonas syringae pv. tomato]MBX6451111.1 tail fiber domain-containing protein [Pseudomonas syringae pv. tomato]MBX6621345.1 tail fiber domain-containing protein [Pseudomonas syringae pv. tomato]